MMDTLEISANSLLGGKKLISQKSRLTDEMELFLAERSMCRKRMPQDESSLYRAVADQLWGDHTRFLRVKKDLHSQILSVNAQIPSDGSFTSNRFIDQILAEFIVIASSIYKRDVRLFLQRGLATLYHAYIYQDSSNVAEECAPDKQVLTLTMDHELHFDSVYTFEEMATLATCQAIVYDVLYSDVFDLHGVAETVTTMLDRSQKFAIQCMKDGRSQDTLARIIQGDYSLYDNEQNLVALTGQGITPFPYKVAKCLSPSIYRNVSFDTWDSFQSLRSKGNYLCIGSKCIVHIKKHLKCMGYVQALNSKDTATVYIEDLGGQCELPQCILQVVTTEASRPPGQSSRAAKVGKQSKMQRTIVPPSVIYQALVELLGEEAISEDKISGVFEASTDEASPNKMSSSPSSPKHSDSDNPDIIFHFSTSSEDGEEDHVASEIRCVEEGTFSVPYKNMLTEGAAPANLTYEYERGASSFLYMQDYSPSSCSSHINEQGLGVSLLNPDPEQGAAGLPQTQSSQASEEQFSTSSSYSGNQQFATSGSDGCKQQTVGSGPRPDFSSFISYHSNQPNFAGYHFEPPNNEGPMQPNMMVPTSHPNSPFYLPIDEDAYFSFAEDGSDLPWHSISTLRYFYNHGIQFAMACKLQDETQKPVFTTPPVLALFCRDMSQARVMGPIDVVSDNGVITLEEYPHNEFSPRICHMITTTNLTRATANAAATTAGSATDQTAGVSLQASTSIPLLGAPQVPLQQLNGNATVELFAGVPLKHPFYTTGQQSQIGLPPTHEEHSIIPSLLGNATLFPGASVLLNAGLQTQASLPLGELSLPPPLGNVTTAVLPDTPVLNTDLQTHVSLPTGEFLMPCPEGNRAAELFPGAPTINRSHNTGLPTQFNVPHFPADFSVPPPLVRHTPAPSDIQYQFPSK